MAAEWSWRVILLCHGVHVMRVLFVTPSETHRGIVKFILLVLHFYYSSWLDYANASWKLMDHRCLRRRAQGQCTQNLLKMQYPKLTWHHCHYSFLQCANEGAGLNNCRKISCESHRELDTKYGRAASYRIFAKQNTFCWKHQLQKHGVRFSMDTNTCCRAHFIHLRNKDNIRRKH